VVNAVTIQTKTRVVNATVRKLSVIVSLLIAFTACVPSGDSAVLAQCVEGALLVLRAGQTRRQDAQRAVQRLA
jgi:hypothetical protein